MKSAVFATLLACAAAFAPASEKSSSTALSAFKDDIGAVAPLGYFDPLGLTTNGDQARFDRLRYVELKHGRIAMMAVVGYLSTAAGNRFDGIISYDGTKYADLPGGLAALKAMPIFGLCQIIGFIGIAEVVFMKDVTGGEFPGDFRNGFLDFGWDTFDEETKLKKRTLELNQGRAAQMGILGLMMHEQLGNVDTLLPPF
jgi:hypothetical protein